MFGKAELLKKLEEIDSRLTAIEALLETEVTWKTVADELKKQNKELMDRLMARNFQELATLREPEGDVVVMKPPKLKPEEDEDNAGAIIDGITTE